ncbi:TIL domain-containing protein [Aphelenchoides fujianensis]|nr:TIL domain-containing protein [Aphelenchoides fujianensis]
MAAERPALLLFLFLLLLIVCPLIESRKEYKKQYYFGRRYAKSVHRYANSPLDCEAHEEFLRCGPEAHCDLTCENFMNPPNCQMDYDNPKCWFPRCVCVEGFARLHSGGHCVPESVCRRQQADFRRRL